MNNVVTIREFTRGIYGYMKPGTYVVTKNGKDLFVVTIVDAARVNTRISDFKQEIPSSPEFINNAKKIVEKKSVYTKPVAKKVEKYVGEGTYGCGCKKEGSVLCKKHHRA